MISHTIREYRKFVPGGNTINLVDVGDPLGFLQEIEICPYFKMIHAKNLRPGE